MLNRSRLVSAASGGNYFELPSTPITAERTTWTMAAWWKPSALAIGTIIGLGKSAGSGYLAMGMNAEGKAFLEGGNGADSFSAAKMTVSTWNHVGARGEAAGNAQSFLNGVESTGTAVGTNTALNWLNIGALNVAASIVSIPTGLVAHAAIWNVQLGVQEMESLAAGLPPMMVRPGSLVFYAPLYNSAAAGNELDLISGSTLTFHNNLAGEAAEGPTKFFLPDPPFVPSVPAGGSPVLSEPLAMLI